MPNDPFRKDIRIANNKTKQPNQFINFNGTNLSQLYNLYSQGNTIILEFLEKRWQPLAALCTNLQSFLSCRLQAAMFLTPKNSQGLKPHIDNHDLFILQVEGSKHWRIYDPIVSLPSVAIQMPDDLGLPLYEVNLQAGDFLYVPRGYIHQALTSDCYSLHLSLVINILTWTDLIAHVLTSVSEQDVRFRNSLPVGFLADSESEASLGKRLAEMLQLLANNATVADTVERLAEHLFQRTPPMPNGYFTQLDALSNINLDID